MYRSVRLTSSLAAVLLDGLVERPKAIVARVPHGNSTESLGNGRAWYKPLSDPSYSARRHVVDKRCDLMGCAARGTFFQSNPPGTGIVLRLCVAFGRSDVRPVSLKVVAQHGFSAFDGRHVGIND